MILSSRLRNVPAGGGSRTVPEALTQSMTTSDDRWAVGDTVIYPNSASYANNNTPDILSADFPVRNGVQFRIKMYGASGGAMNNAGQFGGNGNGATLDVTVDLSSYQEQTLYFFMGGPGQNSTSSIDGSSGRPYGTAGVNGGGAGAGTRGPSGGGRTDLRVTSSDVYSELLVAGGGGGGNGTLGATGTRYQGAAGGSGYAGSYAKDNGGGGGGYYGGNASNADDGSDGGSGTNYVSSSIQVTVHQNTEVNGSGGGNLGDGWFEFEVISVA